MRLLERFEPRNPVLANTVLFVLTLVATGMTLGAAFASVAQAKADLGLQVATCATLLVAVTALRVRPVPALWASYPFLAAGAITLLDLVTHDASVPAQVFFFFPVLYAGAQLRGAASAAVCAASVAGDVIVVFALMPLDKAVVDACFETAALAVTGALLTLVGRRVDTLIAQLERQAAVDPLTGLLTRRVLDRTAVATRPGSAGTALLVMDVDEFKTVNDRYGHPAGDAVLQQLAAILVRASRHDDVISRMGGDEVAVLMPGCTQLAAVERAEDVLAAVRAHRFDVGADTLPLRVTLSIGVAHLPTHAPDLRTLYLAADTALYSAKNAGRNRVAVAEPTAGLMAS